MNEAAAAPPGTRPDNHADFVAGKLMTSTMSVLGHLHPEWVDELSPKKRAELSRYRAMHAQEARMPAVEDDTWARRVGDSFVELLSGTDIKPESTHWLWRGYLARGCLHIAAGAPGVGKSTLMLALAAVISRGGRWPDGSVAPARDVAVWSGEDDASRTLLPRFIAMGGDPARIWFVGNTEAREGRRPFDPATDMRELQAALAGRDIGFLGVDPVVAAVVGDGHHVTDVRRSLQPLVDLATTLDCVTLGVTHFSKGTAGRDPVERVCGSIGFGALARLVFAVAKDSEAGDDRRLFVRAKSNLGLDGGGFSFRLEQRPVPGYPGITASCVAWGDSVDGTARALLATIEGADERDALNDAHEFLRGLLADGPVPARQIKADVNGAGFSWRTIERAKKALGVEAVKEGGAFGGKGQQWFWYLPDCHKTANIPHDTATSHSMAVSCENGTDKGFNHAGSTQDRQGSESGGLQSDDGVQPRDMHNRKETP